MDSSQRTEPVTCRVSSSAMRAASPFGAASTFVTTGTRGAENVTRASAASQAMADYLLPIVHDRRKHPTDDLISDLVTAEIDGKRVVLIDDSIVRGTTSVKIVQMMREAGAKEVHIRVASPMIDSLLPSP